VNKDFADYISNWKHNSYRLFDSPDVIREVALAHLIELQSTKLFYYEADPLELHNGQWRDFSPEESIRTRVIEPGDKRLEGFDVVTFRIGDAPEHSPSSCNDLAKDLPTNAHCLFATREEARMRLESGASLMEANPDLTGSMRSFLLIGPD
jgi:hypothetical protein